ncbi:MAG: TonB-dependent receptor [Candidatus Solibacter usitatus]|nr:TonB-dependent receptor [Candidatus Solibacter usitatus]
MKCFHASSFFFTMFLAVAQSPQATVSGIITDAQKASVPGVEVTAINAATGQTYRTRSNQTGFYSLQALPIGSYNVSAERPGFRRAVHNSLLLTTGQNLEMDMVLEVGSVTESVTVAAQASLLETRTSDSSQLVEARSVEDMPLGDRRTMNIVRMTGAAVFVNYDSGGKPNFSLAGGRTQSQNFYMDGGTIQNMRLGIGQLDTDPPVETVAEVKVLSNSFAAEYGGSAGGVIVATTKSGTNQLRGAAYEYLRNERLDAANFFAPVVDAKKQRAPLRYNVFGVTAGGPVVVPKLYSGKDKAFFYFAYEGSRRRDGFTDQFGVPTPAQRQGDFSTTFAANGSLVPVYDPLTTRVEGGKTVRDLYPGNRIPSGRLDKAAANLMPLYPLPNRAPDNVTGANNYRANYVMVLNRNAYLSKGDINLSDKDRLSVRYLYNSDDRDYTTVMANAAADTRGPALRHQNFFYGTYTRVFTPSLINEFRFTYGNRINHEMSFGLGGGWPSRLGIKGVPDAAFPQFNTTGFRALGNGSQERRQYPIEQLQYVNNLSWTHGRNTFKFGAEIRPSYNYEENYPTISGSFTFSSQATAMPGNASTGYGLASLLAGAVTGFSARQTEVLNRVSWYSAWFVQDDWQPHSDLTLNLGLRWETDTPIRDINNRMNGFDMSARNPVSLTPGVIRFMGLDGFRTSPWSTDWNNFGPRVGLAWKPFGAARTVLRAGFGFFFAHPFDRGAPTSASLGYELSSAINSPDNGVTIPFYLQNGVPGYSPTKPPLNDSYGAVRVGQTANTAVTFFEENRRTGYSMQWNLSLQRDFSGILTEVTYLANASRKLANANLTINQVRPELLTAQSSQKDRPFPQFSNVSLVAPSLGVSNYHALMFKAERRFAKGYSFLANYTWSKFLNNTDEGGSALGAEGGTYSNLYNRRADYGPSENDIPRRLTLSGVYELPFGKGRPHPLAGAADAVLGGWSLGGILTLQSGPPFTVNTQVNSVYSAAGALRADVSRNPALPGGERTLLRWFDTLAFSQPAAAKFGNQGVNILRADGTTNIDFSIMKGWHLPGEGRKLQLRGEFLNAMNHPDFGVPGRTFGGPGFGIVGSARAGRSVQLGLRLVY